MPEFEDHARSDVGAAACRIRHNCTDWPCWPRLCAGLGARYREGENRQQRHANPFHHFPSALALRMRIVRLASIPAASSRARSLRSCRCCSRTRSNWSSITRPRECSASPCHRRLTEVERLARTLGLEVTLLELRRAEDIIAKRLKEHNYFWFLGPWFYSTEV